MRLSLPHVALALIAVTCPAVGAPAAAQTPKTLRVAAKTGPLSGDVPASGALRTNSKDGAAMVYIPAGPFLMGDDDMKDNPRHTVTLSAYWMYKNDVTVAEYKHFCHATGRQMPPAPSFDPNWSQSDHPIVNVTWDDASAYAAWAGAELPTEAQWEKAARGTDGRLYPWGSTFDGSKLWCSKTTNGDAGGTTAVGVYGISPYGCSDMAGNVRQWCRDWYDPDFMKGRAAAGPDPDNQSNNSWQARVLRGGSCNYCNVTYFRASYRTVNYPAYQIRNNGFRCAVRVPALKVASSAGPSASSRTTISTPPPVPSSSTPAAPASGSVRTNSKDGAALVYIPAGPFQMGDDDQSDNPRHTVTLSAYWMYKNDVTVAEYKHFCHATARKMPPAPSFDPSWSQSDHPIVDVTWDDASAYAAWAGAELPTEAQWEKAARGTDGRLYPWGSTFYGSKLWCSKATVGDAGGTTAVGVYGMSPYGCSDMAGNVWQWCRDWYDPDFMKGRARAEPDPDNQSNNSWQARVLRGGSWNCNSVAFCRASFRDCGYNPAHQSNSYGFRCAVRVGSG